MLVAVLILCLLCLANMVFTAGVVRRMREHTTILDILAGAQPDVMHPAGTVIDHYTATSVDGSPIRRDSLAGLTLVGFFSPTCGPCHERLPEFRTRARQTPGGREQVLAVVVHDHGDPTEMVAGLADHAVVAIERPGGPLAQAFGVRGFPAVGLVDAAGVVVASGTDLRSIPVPVVG